MVTVLSGPLTLSFSTTGNDTTGNGSSTPFRTPAGAWTYLKANYDLNYHPVAIVADGPGDYRCTLNVTERLRGQTGDPGQIQFIGNPGHVLDVKSYKWPAVAGQTPISAAMGACFSVKGFFLDHLQAYQEGGYGAVMLSFNVGANAFVAAEDMGFGYNTAAAGYVNNQLGGRLHYFGGLLVEAPQATGTVTITEGSAAATLTGVTGELPITPYVGINGTGIPAHTFMMPGSGSNISLSQPATQTGSFTVSLQTGISALFGIGQLCGLINANWSSPTAGVTWIRRQPFFLWGAFNADALAHINWGSLLLNPDTRGVRTATGIAGQNTITISDGVLPGWVNYNVLGAGIQFDTRIISIAGNILTINKPLAESFSSAQIEIAHRCSARGPKLTATSNCVIECWFDNLPGSVPVISDVFGRGKIHGGSQVNDFGKVNHVYETRSWTPPA